VQQIWPRGRAVNSQPKDNTYGTRNEKRPVVQVVSTAPHEDARRLLASFLRRAFRRPVKDAEVARHMDVFNKRLSAGDPFQDALKEAYRAALTSPEFMLLRSDLASRLSYFLWAGPPDEELIALTERDELRKPEVLRAQAERMLRDAKARLSCYAACTARTEPEHQGNEDENDNPKADSPSWAPCLGSSASASILDRARECWSAKSACRGAQAARILQWLFLLQQCARRT
jgi:hypothetical protein